MLTLLDLPREILQEIHLIALNPSLAAASSQLRAALDASSSYYTAKYLLQVYERYGPTDIILRSVRHPICTVDTVKMIERVWRHRIRPEYTREVDFSDHRARSAVPVLICPELPRRLFRKITADQDVDPLLRHLFERYSPSATSHKGYPLCRSVMAQNVKYIAFLLSHGANPSVNNHLAVEIAISKQRLDIVKMLVERNPSVDRPKGKRAKLEDRVTITHGLVEQALKSGSEEIVHYFVYEKGVMPPLKSILTLSKPGSKLYKQADAGRRRAKRTA